MAAVPEVYLASGTKVPQLAYGTGSLWLKESDGEIDRPTVEGVKAAIELGYRHLDGAQRYHNEAELGLGIKESGIPRSDLFITTKAVGHKDVEGLLRASLQKMGLDYVDLYLIHEPFSAGGSDESLQETWRGMEASLEKGLARNIGVSNFLVPHIEAILKTATIKPVVNQVELHPYLPRTKLVQFCKSQNITVEAFASLTPLTKAAPGPIDDVAKKLAEKHGVSTSTILLRWLIENGIVAVTTSSKKERLEEYITQVSALKLSEQEVEEIRKAGEGKNFRSFFGEYYGEDCWE